MSNQSPGAFSRNPAERMSLPICMSLVPAIPAIPAIPEPIISTPDYSRLNIKSLEAAAAALSISPAEPISQKAICNSAITPATPAFIISAAASSPRKIEAIGDYYGYGVFTQTGGTNIVSSKLMLGDSTTSTGVYNLNGGVLVLNALTKSTNQSAFNFGGGTLQASNSFSTAVGMNLTGTGGKAKIDTAGYQVTLSGVLSGEGGLEKQGAGTLILSGKNTYMGDTSVLAGVLQISGDYTNGGKFPLPMVQESFFGTPYSASPAPESTAGWSSSGTEKLSAVSLSAISMTGFSGGTAQSLSHPTSTAGQASSGTQGEIVAVPEPGTLVLLAAGLLGIAVTGWRKRV